LAGKAFATLQACETRRIPQEPAEGTSA